MERVLSLFSPPHHSNPQCTVKRPHASAACSPLRFSVSLHLPQLCFMLLLLSRLPSLPRLLVLVQVFQRGLSSSPLGWKRRLQGLSIGTVLSSTLLFDPPIPEVADLKLWLRFQAEIFDGTGSLTTYVEHKEAEILLGMSSEEIIEAVQEGCLFSLDHLNETFKGVQFLFQVRTSENEVRGRKFVRNTIIACLPSSESS